ncbi:MAG: DUF2156 domain-containing protein [Clostridia bacterium]|nr:DUF2156 domain-containing protein [Clostridia bacterium]
MIEFKKIELSDKDWIEGIIRNSSFRGADYNFNNIYMWERMFRPCISRLGDRLMLKIGCNNDTLYSFPAGTGPLAPAIEALKEDAADRGGSMRMRGITEEALSELQTLCPDEFDVKFDEDGSDYVYLAEKLADLAGKKLHAKRNHIHRFEEENDWSFEPVTLSNLGDCAELEKKWLFENSEEKHMNYSDENDAIGRMFRHFEVLKMDGGLLRAGGMPIAFTIGSILSDDTYNTHYEKADSHIQGAYPMINREFARYIMRKYPNIIYINREEDMGLENLRKAKRSYYPDLFIKKYVASWR